MGYEVRTEIIINASQERIWRVITDFKNYSNWNPFITSIEGKPEIGETLIVNLTIPNQGKMTFKPKVTAIEDNYSLAWLGKFLFTGLFDGAHSFHIEKLSEGQCKFIHCENFSGLLVRMMWKKLSVNTKAGFEAMNQAVKQYCEGVTET